MVATGVMLVEIQSILTTARIIEQLSRYKWKQDYSMDLILLDITR